MEVIKSSYFVTISPQGVTSANAVAYTKRCGLLRVKSYFLSESRLCFFVLSIRLPCVWKYPNRGCACHSMDSALSAQFLSEWFSHVLQTAAHPIHKSRGNNTRRNRNHTHTQKGDYDSQQLPGGCDWINITISNRKPSRCRPPYAGKKMGK